LEYYRDQLANIAHRGTAGVGFGYYIFDTESLEWKAAAGPGYQYTRFSTVEPGESNTASTPAGILQSSFKADITSRITFTETYSGIFASQDAGLYTHHLVSTLEYEIKRSMDLDISFVWDYLNNPRVEGNGNLPKQTDLWLIVGVGFKF
jgi:putative salt-induced outer membrane protein YdiY